MVILNKGLDGKKAYEKLIIPSLKASPFRVHECTYTANNPWWNICILNFNAG